MSLSQVLRTLTCWRTPISGIMWNQKRLPMSAAVGAREYIFSAYPGASVTFVVISMDPLKHIACQDASPARMSSPPSLDRTPGQRYSGLGCERGEPRIGCYTIP